MESAIRVGNGTAQHWLCGIQVRVVLAAVHRNGVVPASSSMQPRRNARLFVSGNPMVLVSVGALFLVAGGRNGVYYSGTTGQSRYARLRAVLVLAYVDIGRGGLRSNRREVPSAGKGSRSGYHRDPVLCGCHAPVDIIFDTNYGYVGPTRPSVPTLIDFLGPWPLRVIWLILIGASVFVLAWAPWAIFCRHAAET